MDFWKSDGFEVKSRSILVASDFEHLGNGRFTCQTWNPEGISSSCIIQDFLKFGGDHQPVESTLLWDVRKSPPLPQTKYVLFQVNTMPEDILMDYQVDSGTIPMPCLQDDQPIVRVIEMFSGGVGGWMSACTYMQHAHATRFATLALEVDIDAAYAYAVSHDVPIVSGKAVVDPALASMYQHLVVHADIAGNTWLELASAWKPDIMLISAPCQPWSTAGSYSGIYADDGQLLFRAVSVCKLLRPRIIGIEQVSGFASHEHFRMLIQTLRWAGYALHHAQTLDAADLLPITRSRWIAIAVRVNDDAVVPSPFQTWTLNKAHTPRTWNAMLPDAMLTESLFPSDEVLRLSARHELLPPAKRRVVSKEHVLRSRCTEGKEKIPALMASYGSQHCFSFSWLEERGLLNHFVLHPTRGPRYWHPIELWLLHGVQNKQMLMLPFEKAFKHLGNQICVPHALLGLANMLNCLRKTPKVLNVSGVIEAFLSDRITVDSLHVCHTSQGVIAAGNPIELDSLQQLNIEQFHQGLEEGTIPHGKVWTIAGFQSVDAQIHEDETTIPATIAFPTFEKVHICVSGQTHEIWIQQGIDDRLLVQLWNHSFMFLDGHDRDAEGTRFLVPSDVEDEACHDKGKISLIRRHDATFAVSHSADAFRYFLEESNGVFCGITGSFIDGSALDFPDFAFSGFQLSKPRDMPCKLAKFFHAMMKCRCVSVAVQSRFQLNLAFSGPPEDVDILCRFWAGLLNPSDLHNLGLHIRFTGNLDARLMVWEVAGNAFPFPIHLLKRLLVIRAFQKILTSQHTDEGLTARIKLFAQVVWEGKLPSNVTIATFKQCLHSVSWVAFDQANFRIVSCGKQQPESFTVREAHHDGQRRPGTFHFILQMQGGGMETGTKAGHKTQIKNAFAAALLQEGHDLAWTSKTVDTVVAKVGQKELAKILQTEVSQRFQLVCSFLAACEIAMPKIQTGKTSQSAAQAKRKKQDMLPNPENYKALAGVLVNEDGTPTAHLPQFGGHLQGYHMCLPSVAAPWLTQGDLLSKDELILLVFGDLTCTTTLQQQKITLPCIDEHGRNVLVACTMIQCGEKKVKVLTGDGHNISEDGTILTAVTWWKEDWPQQWSEISQNPYKALRNFPGVANLLVSVWGKAYREGKHVATPNSATSIQVHCLMKEDDFSAFLKLSGFNSLWLCPKTREGRPHPKWRIIWLENSIDVHQATVLAAKLPDAAGLTKQAGRLALRVPKGSFDASWKILFPTKPLPADVDTSRTYKVESLPFGVTKSMLEQWAEHNSWKMKPLRAIGPRSWIVGTGDEPPSLPLHFNSSPVLIRELTNRTSVSANPIIAGPKPTASSAVAAHLALGPLQSDPWARYQGTKPAVAATSAIPSATPANVGPTEQQFSQQADRISKLEDAVQQMQLTAANQTASIETLQLENQKRDVAIRSHIDERLGMIKKELDQSFADAIKQQSQSFSSNLDEIKNLLKTKKHKRKKLSGANGEDESMSENS